MGSQQVDRLLIQIDNPLVVALRRRLENLVRHGDHGVTNR
jgi:hypothetical protein